MGVLTLCRCYFVSSITNVLQFHYEIKNQVLFTSARFKAIYMQIQQRNIFKMFSSLNKLTKNVITTDLVCILESIVLYKKLYHLS